MVLLAERHNYPEDYLEQEEEVHSLAAHPTGLPLRTFDQKNLSLQHHPHECDNEHLAHSEDLVRYQTWSVPIELPYFALAVVACTRACLVTKLVVVWVVTAPL